MRRIVMALAGTVSGLIMLFSYHTSTVGIAAPGSAATVDLAARGATSTDATGNGTVTGDVVQTRWGPVQVQITVQSGRISDVTVVQSPTGNQRDQEINGYALPILDQETIDAQSAQIDHVSGASVTSEGYVASLQSALDLANL